MTALQERQGHWCEVASQQLLTALGLQRSGGITRYSAHTRVIAVQAFHEHLCGYVQGHQAASAEHSSALSQQSPFALRQWVPRIGDAPLYCLMLSVMMMMIAATIQ